MWGRAARSPLLPHRTHHTRPSHGLFQRKFQQKMAAADGLDAQTHGSNTDRARMRGRPDRPRTGFTMRIAPGSSLGPVLVEREHLLA